MTKTLKHTLLGLILVMTVQLAFAQPTMVLHYRHVPQENVDEFIKRETTYWQKIAQKAIDDGKLGFWGLFEKVSVYYAPNTSNYVFVNVMPNADAEGIWNPSEVFPDVAMEDMETWSLSTVTSQIFASPLEWVDGENAVPEDHYNYIVFNYFDPENTEDWLAMESEAFKPYFTEAMKNEGTSQCAWGNARIIAPLGGGMNATTISMDMYPSMQAALHPSSPVQMTEGTMQAITAEWDKLKNPHHRVLYRIVAVASSE